jgi:hypothetical protein
MTGEEMRSRLWAIGVRSQVRAAKVLGRSQGTVSELYKKREVPRSVEAHVQALELIHRMRQARGCAGVIIDA